jgi:hypothetical protein
MAFINIFYKVDKSQLEASTAAVNQAKAATDQLNASAAKLGVQGAKANSTYTSSIDSAKLKVESLRRQIELANQADTKRLSTLKTQYAAAQAQLDKYNQSLKTNQQATQQAATTSNSLASSFGNIYNAVKLIIGAQIAKQFVNIAIEAAALSGKVEGVERAFNRAFPNATLILADLRRATKGAVSDFELMQRTLQATNLGVAVEQLPVLFEFAAARAQQTGESVDYLVDSIVRGIGRKSLLILDNLGLSAIRLKEQFNGAAIASLSVSEVTQGVAKIAKVELEKMGGYIETNATRVDRLKVSWTQLGIEISKLISGEGGIVTFLNGYVVAFERVFEAINKNISVQELLRQKSIEEAAQLGVNIIKQNEFTGVKEHDLQITREIIAEKTHELIQQQEEIKNQKAQLELSKSNLSRNYATYDQDLKNITLKRDGIKVNENSNKILIEQIKILKGLEASLVVKNELDNENVDTLEVLESKVKDLNEQIQNTANISTKSGIENARRLKEEVIQVQERIDLIKDQIYWEEILRDRRAKGKLVSSTDKIDSDKLMSDLGLIGNVSTSDIPPIQLPAPIIPLSEWDKFEAAFKEHYKQIVDYSTNIINDQAQSLLQKEISDFDIKIQATRDFYDEQILLAGDNEKAKDRLRLEEDKKIKQLEKQRADREKKAALTGIIVNTALGIIKAIATAVTIYDGLVEAAGVAIEGASQYAIASRANYYAKGVIDLKGPGTGTSDSIPSMLSRGESIMTAKETQDSNKTLKAIRAKTLNDKVLDRIVNQAKSGGGVVGFDDSRLLESNKRIERAVRSNDIVRKGSTIYEAKQEGENMKRYIRSKSLN